MYKLGGLLPIGCLWCQVSLVASQLAGLVFWLIQPFHFLYRIVDLISFRVDYRITINYKLIENQILKVCHLN